MYNGHTEDVIIESQYINLVFKCVSNVMKQIFSQWVFANSKQKL